MAYLKCILICLCDFFLKDFLLNSTVWVSAVAQLLSVIGGKGP